MSDVHAAARRERLALSIVTGASGHLGVNLVRELLARGVPVRAVVHRSRRGLEGLGLDTVRADVLDPASLRRAFDGAEVVYHLAGLVSITGNRDGLVQAVNADGVENVCQAALEVGVRRLVHVSSIHAFRQRPLDEPLDERRAQVAGDRGAAAYDRSKAEGELRVRAALERGLDALIVNPTGFIGPHDYEPSRMGRVFLAFARRRLPAAVAGGLDFVDVRDVAAALVAAQERGRSGENYLLGGRWISMTDLFGLFARVTGVPAPRLTVPARVAALAIPAAALRGRLAGREPLVTREALRALKANRDVRHDKAARELGHDPRPLLETVEALHDWFVGRRLVPARGRRAG